MSTWSPAQRCYRALMVGLRNAYYHDRAKFFWARHRVKVEFYKYGGLEPTSVDARHTVNLGNEIAAFVQQSMQFSVTRIEEHNALVARLPIREAKACRQRFLEAESDHDTWCRQRVKAILRRRPPAPFPYA